MFNNDIHQMHKKFGVHNWVDEKASAKDWDVLRKFLEFRLKFIQEELDETKSAVSTNNPEEVVDGLIDILVVAIGTLDAFNVNTARAWQEVLRANMAKEVGVKETRPNPLGLPDLIKPKGWTGPSHKGNVGLLGATVHPEDKPRCNCHTCFMGRGYDV